MVVVTYKWREGSRISLDPVLSGKELEKIREKRRKITREILAEEARSRKSMFHNHVWGASDPEAAWEYRLVRAGEIIRAVVVVYKDNGGMPIEVPAFPSMPAGDDRETQSFVPIGEILNDLNMRKVMIADFLARMRNLRRQYGNLTELVKVWDAVDRVST